MRQPIHGPRISATSFLLGRNRALRGLALGLLLGSAICAQVVVPSSYTSTPGEGQAQGGSYNYFDDTGSQLTDTTFGAHDWTANLGNGNAWEWVGWITVDPTLTFNFSSNVLVSAVTVGFNRAEGAGIFLPSLVTIGSESFSLSSDAFPDNTRKDIRFELKNPAFGSQLALTFSDGTSSRWIFVDEVQFSAVPEPSVVVLLGGGGVLIAGLRRRRRTD